MLARVGMVEGEMEWVRPCRAMNAIWAPLGNAAMVTGELGNPHGLEPNG